MKTVELNKVIAYSKAFSQEDVLRFSEISEDDNPIHLNADYASKSIFKKQVVHGVLLVSMFSKIFGTIYPGNGGIYLSQSSKFLRPAFIGEMIKAKVKLLAFDDAKKQGTFSTECFNEAEKLILTGEAKILFPKEFQLKPKGLSPSE